MELAGNYIMSFIETSGMFAPLLFISIHLIRPLFFLPAIFICISGGVLFGAIAGSFYSIIGITLSSFIFYVIILWMPRTFKRFVNVKQKMIGTHSTFTTPQIAFIRLIPFIHFNLLAICLFEICADFKDYAKSSFLSSIPFVIVYTSLGEWISRLSSLYILPLFVCLLVIIFMLRKKEIYIKWQDFFPIST